MTAEGFYVGAFVGLVVTSCAYELGTFLASLKPVQQAWDRPSALPAYRIEANNAKRGKW